jgi:hypothetical protein
MSSINLGNITSKFHEGLGTAVRLNKLASNWQPGEVYTFDHLYQEVSPSSPQALSLILSELVQRGFLEKLVRVESPFTGGGIKDFSSVADVPERIYDFHSDREIEVEPDNLRILFKVPPHGAKLG